MPSSTPILPLEQRWFYLVYRLLITSASIRIKEVAEAYMAIDSLECIWGTYISAISTNFMSTNDIENDPLHIISMTFW